MDLAEEMKELDVGLKSLLSAEQANRFRVVPKEEIGDCIRLVTDLEDPTYLPQLKLLLGKKIELSAIESSQFQRLLSLHYPLADRVSPSRSQSETLESDSDIIRLVDRMLTEAAQIGASDVHIERYEELSRVRFRWEGQLIEKYKVPQDQYNALISRIKILADLDISERRLPQDGRINIQVDGKKIDVRVSTIPGKYGEKVVMRLLTRSKEHLQLANLGLAEAETQAYERAIRSPNGIVLITGPTGSGKTTTLYATLSELNKPDRNILTIEDPIEYNLQGINQVQLKEGIGLTFDRALRAFLRQDPDIIMVGEIRDRDTAQIAIRAALTGHLVFSTLHTNSAWDAITRLTDMGVEPYLLAAALRMVVAQRLVRVLCTHCKRPSDDLLYPDFQSEHQIKNHMVPVGCEHCYYTGYSGRRAVFEFVPIQADARNYVKEGTTLPLGYIWDKGLHSLSQNLGEMVQQGATSLAEVSIHIEGE